MKTVFKSKHKHLKNINYYKIVLSFLLIFMFTFLFLYQFQHNVSKHLVDISTAEVNRIMHGYITDKINHSILNRDSLNDILIIHKNKNDEILYVDFNLDKAYQVLDTVSNVLTDCIHSIENGEVDIHYYNNELSHKASSILLNIPLGSATKSFYFYELGPKIPVEINFIGSVLTNLETKITNYGLNNALVEVFVYIEFHNQVLSPFQYEDVVLKYDTIIASMMIEGSVPNFYNGSIDKSSEIYSKTIN